MSRPSHLPRAELLWGLATQAVNIGAGLILLPVVLHYQSAADVGLWFVFLTLANLSMLLDCGFSPTIARNVAYACAGARALTSTGVPDLQPEGAAANLVLLGGILQAGRRIYQRVAGLAALLLLVAGTAYIAHLAGPRSDLPPAPAGRGGRLAVFWRGQRDHAALWLCQWRAAGTR